MTRAALPTPRSTYAFRVRLRVPREGLGRYIRRMRAKADELSGGRQGVWTEFEGTQRVVCWGFISADAAARFRFWIAEHGCGDLLLPEPAATARASPPIGDTLSPRQQAAQL